MKSIITAHLSKAANFYHHAKGLPSVRIVRAAAGDDFNGWFAYNDWTISDGRNYQYIQEAVINIHP
jgi:hypothetical protein